MSSLKKNIGSMWHEAARAVTSDLSISERELGEKVAGLDEAAEEYAYVVYPSEGVANIEIANAFKAGAEWMAEQGVNSEGKVFTSAFTSYVKTPGIEKLLKNAFPEDTEVIVQIRKKQ